MVLCKTEHPRPDFRREQWLNLNGEWEFKLSGNPVDNTNVTVYDEKINVPFSWACPLSGIHRDAKGYGYYRKTIKGSEAPRGRRLFACFGGVDYLASVRINGSLAAIHEGGYTPFEAELTAHWRGGADRTDSTGSSDMTDVKDSGDVINELCVEATDLDEKYQTYGKQGYGNIRGIWQTVYLEARPDDYISSIYFTTVLSGHIFVKMEIDSLHGGTAEAEFEFNGIGYKGGSVEMKPGSNIYETEFCVENPRHWDCDDPYLYEGTVSLKEADGSGNGAAAASCDTVHTYFGIREIGTIKLDGYKTKHITLNGKPVYLNGTLDQAFNSEGFFTYPDETSICDEVWRLKRIGLNFVRIHIKPEEPRKLYWLDKMGIMVMEDMPCFWDEPGEQARDAYQKQWREVIKRDYNHPSIISWVMFNETWGLLSSVKTTDGQKETKVYLPETQEWVRKIYQEAKAADPTRLIEDNSPCRCDHVQSDINTWHFYKNGYDNVKSHITEVADKTYPGSPYNYTAGNLQGDAPLLNSECGMVWGIEGSAGDSDISWHYRYMLNEFRLHGNICGFVFTEFHDVVNEFNGYYRIDNTDKYFGYGEMCRGMTIRDLHAPDFVALDVPPCSVFGCAGSNACCDSHDLKNENDGEKHGIFRVPLVISSFSSANHGKQMTLKWELWYDGIEGRVTVDIGTIPTKYFRYGTSEAGAIEAKLPDISALCVLSVWLCDDEGATVSRNFTCARVKGRLAGNKLRYAAVEPLDYKKIKFDHVWDAMEGNKLCASPEGYVEYEIHIKNTTHTNNTIHTINNNSDRHDKCLNRLTLYFEAGAKHMYEKDILKKISKNKEAAGEFMLGYREKPSKNPNTYYMTDEHKHPSGINVYINDIKVDFAFLPDDPADCRGVLSWIAQPADGRHLDEAGSYGYLCRIEVPSRLLPQISQKGKFNLLIEVDGIPGGLAIYGSKCGRYPCPILAIFE